jgi:rifampin ADP-ribosylating transferase
MEFDPRNDIVKLCVQGSALEENGEFDEAAKVFLRAWDESVNDLEKFLSAHFIALRQKDIADKLKWLETALRFALKNK